MCAAHDNYDVPALTKPAGRDGRSVGCEECEKRGDSWVHLRICLTCGHVVCCDDSPNRHATAHARVTGHPVIASFEPGEQWAYCYADDKFFKRLPPHFQIVRRET
jgi:uncharacterized UBP type Zn finger protein